jgi:hypothetical protein
VGSYVNDPLLSDGHDITSTVGTAASGQPKRVRGEIVHLDRATGAVTTAVTGAAATAANAVVAENADPTSTAVGVLVYLTGKMKADAVIWPPAGSHAAHTEDLRQIGIYLESVVFRDGLTVKSAPNADEEKVAKERLEEARKRLKEGKEDEEAPDQSKRVAESSWSLMNAQERLEHPELAMDAIPKEGEDEETDEEGKPKKKTPPTQPPPKPPEKPTEPPHRR